MSSIADLISREEGRTYRYRTYYGGIPIPRETVWEVKKENHVCTLYHYDVPLVHWNEGDTSVAWLSEYSQIHHLTASDKNGINAVNGKLI